MPVNVCIVAWRSFLCFSPGCDGGVWRERPPATQALARGPASPEAEGDDAQHQEQEDTFQHMTDSGPGPKQFLLTP